MRLAIITHNVNKGDGQGRVNYEIARYALRRGARVWLLANWVEPDLIELGATWIPVQPRPWPCYLPKVWEFAASADRVLDRLVGEFDIIHGYGFVLGRPHQVNTSQFVHAAWGQSPVHTARLRRDLYGAYQWAYTTFNTRWERQAYQQAQVVVAASERVRQELLAIGVPGGRIRVITNGADPQEFAPGAADRTALSLPQSVPLALFVGEIRTPRKNLDTVLHALPRAPGIHLAVAGALERSPSPKLAARLGIAERVHFLGFRRDVADVMRAVDLFVFPSRYEPFGIVVLEAMASGVPVITARTVGAASLVTAETGIVLPDPNDAHALAEALQALMNDPGRRAAMGQAARQVAEQHSWQHMAEAYWQLYQEVARV